jgi:nicotinate-nucleotide pyrophosphorylase (carboxylating)
LSTLRLPDDICDTVARALAEDIGSGDLTASLIDPSATLHAQLRVREDAVLCGAAWFDEVFRQLDPAVSIDWRYRDGDDLPADVMVCLLAGPAPAILTGERTAINFLQTLSGTATTARNCAAATAGTGARVVDTRKTIPGLRLAQKYAVRCGGAHNHRIGLHDAILIKENHIAAAGGIEGAVAEARRRYPTVPVEVEVESLEQLIVALGTATQRVMLDNFTLPELRSAVALRDAATRRIELEASGGFDIGSLREAAETGVDFISVGALTKHLHAVDFSLRYR